MHNGIYNVQNAGYYIMAVLLYAAKETRFCTIRESFE